MEKNDLRLFFFGFRHAHTHTHTIYIEQLPIADCVKFPVNVSAETEFLVHDNEN